MVNQKGGILSSPFFKVGVIGLVLLIIIMIIGSILGGNGENAETYAIRLLLHLDNTAEVISDYQSGVKSSDLRSSVATLYSVLSNTSREVTSFLENKYGYNSSSADKDLVEEADLSKDELVTDLFQAKINGTLDRIIAHKMQYEITMFNSEETDLYKATSDNSLRTALESSLNSLETLYDKFNSFSEAK